MRRGFSWALVVVLATQPACVAEIRARCPVISEPSTSAALPHDFAQLDGLLTHRALQMMHDVDQLHGSATTSFHIVFARDTLPLLCGRMAQARELARAGQFVAAGRKYQALLVASQVMELAVAVHAVVEYADAVREPSLVLVQTLGTFGNQMTPILEAALTEEPARIQSALRAQPEAFRAWAEYLERWSTHIHADAERMEVAKRVWDITIGVIAAYETAGALAEVAATGGPPIAPALAAVGGAGTVELNGAAYVELAESIRRLIASGALDASVVAALSATTAHMATGPKVEPPSTNEPAHGRRLLASRFGSTPERAALLERVTTEEGGLNTSKTVAEQLAGPRSYIPSQSVLETIGSGVRTADPKGVAGHFMYRASATLNGSRGVLEVLVDEASGQIRHVLFVSGATL
jgi:hypothetical protein